MIDDESAAIKRALRDVLEEFLLPRHARLAPKWHGGTLTFTPENTTLQSKQVDVEAFFHKLIMVREALRVLEQKINNHPKLDDADRVELSSYLARAHGSLTTFNIFFADEDDRFVGQRTKD